MGYSIMAVGMILFRRTSLGERPALRRLLVYAWLLINFAVFGGSAAAQASAVMKEPDDTRPVQITGCMTARTRSGGFILSGVFGRPVTVIGPNYLQVGLGHQVTLTGTWQANGIARSGEKSNESRMFVATAVKVTAKQCAAPPSATPNSAPPAENKKDQR